MLVLLGGFEILVVASVVLNDAELYFHVDEAEEAGVSFEPFVIFSHDSNFVLDVREGDAEESVDEFEGLAELMHDLEELFEGYFFGILIFLEEVTGLQDNVLDVEPFFILLHLTFNKL